MSRSILQDPLDFSVQIRDTEHKRLVGSGVAVSPGGKIVTCAHVVREAGVNPQQPDDKTVGVYFPQARGGETKERQARVTACFPAYDDDVVLLELTGGPPPLAPEQVAILGTAQESTLDDFLGLGFSPIGKYESRLATGKIAGRVFPPQGANLQAKPVQLKTTDIRPGMSGAGVLDKQRNLVIGLITERWNPGNSLENNDLGYATDALVLTFDPFLLPVQGESVPPKTASRPSADFEAARSAAGPKTRFAWNGAPQPLEEWVGRRVLLDEITNDWNDPDKRVTGLIGFGGEGKSSLARQWVEKLLNDASQPQPEAVFWWGFYENRSVDEFFEAALKYVSGERITPRQIPSSTAKAHFVAAMLASGRYLFVLDGLEVMQHQEGDQYGQLQSSDLKAFLSYFAGYDHPSFCIITSRAPLLDLLKYNTYTHRDLERLLPADGRALLLRLGVKGSDAQLDQVVSAWDGHALTLSLLGSYLSEHYGGEIAHLADIPAPIANEPRYERVHRVLRRYDEHLTQPEREFLKLFSAFRTPVHEGAFEKVFVPLLHLAPDIVPVGYSQITDMVNRLVAYRILRYDAASQTYTAHPLVHNHYLAILTKNDPGQQKDAHEHIKDYYLSIAGDTPKFPTIDDLKPLIEVVHHACQAGAYDEAFNAIYWERISQQDRFVLQHQLGAFETTLALLTEFFPHGDTSQEPDFKDRGDKRWILGMVGSCLMSLGRLREAMPFYERSNNIALNMQDWDASATFRNLADLHASLGALEASAAAARQSLELARRVEKKDGQCYSLAFQGLVTHLLGDLQTASDAFAQAEKLEQEIDSSKRYLYSLRGINHADHLRRIGQSDYARRVSEANLQTCERNHWPDDTSSCHRILGDLDSDSGNHAVARAHYETALKIARSIQKRKVLIEALLARGRFCAKDPKGFENPSGLDEAFNDLNEALGYCVESGYRIHEADVRVALGWAWLANGEAQKAKESAARALQMSEEMGYYWGKVDAGEVLERVENGE